MRARRFLPGAVVSILSLLASVAVAAEGGHGHGGGIPVLTILFSTINLLIFAAILARFAVPGIRVWVRTRRNNVVTNLEEAAAARGDAMRLKADWEEKVAKVDVTIREMHEQARQDAARERERILANAREVAGAILRDTERTIAAELRRMRAELRAELAREAVKIAEDEVRKRWTAADQQRFVADFVKQVAK